MTAGLVHAAANEVQPSEKRVRSKRWPMMVAAASTALLLVVTLWSLDLPVLEKLKYEQASEPNAIRAPQKTAQAAVSSPTAQQQVGSETEDAPVGGLPQDSMLPEEASTQPRTDWLKDQHRRAWQSMAELWQDSDSAAAIRTACEGGIAAGYACLLEQGNWSRIRKLGLPVILILRGDDNNLLLLRGFSEDGLLLGAGEESIEVPRDDIERKWFGEYYVTWPQAPDWPVEIRRGESGAAVDIVMAMAELAEPAWGGSGVFDSGFESWLMAFQRRNGLKADGIVGPNTLIYLMAPTIIQPRLVVAAGERS